MFIKNLRGRNTYKLYLAFFYAQPVGRMALFLSYVVMHRLVAYCIKSVHENVILIQNTLSQNKVKI